MTQIWKGEKVFPVTKIKAGPCTVVQLKNSKKDGYDAVVLGYESKKEKHTAKPQKGHFAGLDNFRYLREFRSAEAAGRLKRGDVIDVSSFSAGEAMKVVGTSKGKGFQGVVKRHGFHGQNKTHGTKDQVRMPGSIGSTGPQRVFKGVKMAGRMGNERVTTANLEIIEIDNENGLIYIKGAVPGARNSLILLSGQGELTAVKAPAEQEPAAAAEEVEKPEEPQAESGAAADGDQAENKESDGASQSDQQEKKEDNQR